MVKSITIDVSPTFPYKSTYQKEQGALWLMEIGDYHAHHVILVTRSNHDGSTGTQLRQLPAIHIECQLLQRLYRGQRGRCVLGLPLGDV